MLGPREVAGTRRRRPRPEWAVGLASCALTLAGCAVHEQIQYFAATDPETGATNYYKLTVSGWGGAGTDYHLQAGYFSAAAVDVLRGAMPDIPVLDLPVEQIEHFDKLAERFYARLLQEAKELSPITDPEARMVTLRKNIRAAESRLAELTLEQQVVDEEMLVLASIIAEHRAQVTAAQRKREEAANKLEELRAQLTATQPGVLAPTPDALENARRELRESSAALLEKTRELLTLERRLSAFERKNAEIAGEVARRETAIAAGTKLLSELEGKALAADGDIVKAEGRRTEFTREDIIGLARLVWLGSLSQSDLASIGMTENVDPFQFRKLVFWATGNNVDLQAYASEIDGVIDNVVTIAQTAKAQAAARKAERRAAREARQASLRGLVGVAVQDPIQAASINGVLDVLFPNTSSQAKTPMAGGD